MIRMKYCVDEPPPRHARRLPRQGRERTAYVSGDTAVPGLFSSTVGMRALCRPLDITARFTYLDY